MRFKTAPGPLTAGETVADLRAEGRRERVLDMERRLRPYRLACYGVLAIALLAVAPEIHIGWIWILPLTFGLVGFAVADRFMAKSSRPAAWVAAAWGILPLLLGAAVLASGGPSSPLLVWFAVPAVTLGARFDPRGTVIGTAYLMAVFLATTVLAHPSQAADERQLLIAVAALIVSTVILSAALANSERTHRRRSTLDPLTGLFNRNALEQRLAELHGQHCDADEGLSHALLVCDLDHFKQVNDQLGHSAGDAVLQDVAYVMRATLRAGDSIFRIGGEEILVLLPGASRPDAVEIAERLRDEVRERRPVGVTVTVSIGVAVTESKTVDTDDLIARADLALYEAKDTGRDAVVVAGPAAFTR
jgi:diguanylate cyclase (GGDEF)-like protein